METIKQAPAVNVDRIQAIVMVIVGGSMKNASKVSINSHLTAQPCKALFVIAHVADRAP